MAHKGSYNTGIDSLTRDEIRDIFTGKIKNWSELGGDDQPIVVINREKSSGTRAAFGSLALGGDVFTAGEELDSSGKVQATPAREARSDLVSRALLSRRHGGHPAVRRHHPDGREHHHQPLPPPSGHTSTSTPRARPRRPPPTSSGFSPRGAFSARSCRVSVSSRCTTCASSGTTTAEGRPTALWSTRVGSGRVPGVISRA